MTVKAFDDFLCVLVRISTYIIVLTEIEDILFLLLFGYPNIMILIEFKKRRANLGVYILQK